MGKWWINHQPTTQVNSALHPFCVGKSNTSLLAGIRLGVFSLVFGLGVILWCFIPLGILWFKGMLTFAFLICSNVFVCLWKAPGMNHVPTRHTSSAPVVGRAATPSQANVSRQNDSVVTMQHNSTAGHYTRGSYLRYAADNRVCFTKHSSTQACRKPQWGPG